MQEDQVMSNTEKLGPCPICGGTNIVRRKNWVYCETEAGDDHCFEDRVEFWQQLSKQAEEARQYRKLVEGLKEPVPTPMPEWLERQIQNVERTVAAWPKAKRIASGIDKEDE